MKIIHSYSLFQIRSSKLLFMNFELESSTFIIINLFILMIIIFAWRRAHLLIKNKIRDFFSHKWNIVDISIIIIASVLIIFYFVRARIVKDLLAELDRVRHNEFISFIIVSHWDDYVIVLAGILVAISMIRIWHLLEFHNMFRICELTLKNAAKDVFIVLILGVIILLAFSISGYIIFGSYSYEFWSVTVTAITLLSLSMGYRPDFRYEIFDKINNNLGYIYYIFFMFMMLTIITVFITVVNNAYAKSRQYFDETDEKKALRYNLLQYVKEEFQYYTNKLKRKDIDHLKVTTDNDNSELEQSKLSSLLIRLQTQAIENFIENLHEKKIELTKEKYNFLATVLEFLVAQQYDKDAENSKRNVTESRKRNSNDDILTIVNYLKNDSELCDLCSFVTYTDMEQILTNKMKNVNNKIKQLFRDINLKED